MKPKALLNFSFPDSAWERNYIRDSVSIGLRESKGKQSFRTRVFPNGVWEQVKLWLPLHATVMVN